MRLLELVATLMLTTSCPTTTEKKEREEREAREAAERAAAKAKAEKEAAEAAARALLEKKEREAAEAAARAKKEQEEREERERAEKEAEEARKAKEAKEAAAAAAAAASRNHRGVSHSNLDQFDLGALDGHERMSEFSDFGSEFGDYSFMTNNHDSMRLSEVLDLESIDAFNNGTRSSRGFDRLSTFSDLSAISDRASDVRADRRTIPSSLREEDSEYLSDEDGEQELCGGCNLVLEGEAVGALNRYFHYEVRGVCCTGEALLLKGGADHV